jgi:hypothetical protein
MEFTNDMEATEPLFTYVPREFSEIATSFHQTPEYLAYLLLGDFCQHPPKGIYIISDDPPDARNEGEAK